MFEHNGQVHLYCPGAGADNPLRSNFYALNFEKVGDILVSACVCVWGDEDIVLKLHVWIPHGKIVDAYFWFFPELSPLVKLRPFDKQGDEIL